MKNERQRKTAKTGSYESHFDNATLFEFSRLINSSLDLKFVLGHILLTIMGKTMSPKGMAVIAHEKSTFVVEMVKGFSQELQGTSLTIKNIPQSIFYLEKLDPLRHPWKKFFINNGVHIVLPMFSPERAIGVLGFAQRLSSKKLSTREQTYLRSLANISATAIEKSFSIQQLVQVNRTLDRKIQELNTLFELGKEFNAVIEQDKVVRLLVFSLLGQVGVNRYLVCLKDGADLRVVASRVDGPVPHSEMLRTLSSVKTPTLVSTMTVNQAVDPREVLKGLGLNVVVPMQLQNESKGMILLGEKLNKEEFSKTDFEFVASLANLAIISLENARLFKEAIEKQRLEDELLIAREIQKGLLPSVLPTIPGVDIAAINVSSKQVGGDYYDAIPLRDGRYVIAIGDVSGKGPPAALLMANLQATIRALVPLDLSLSELTGRVNDLMCQNTGGNRFVTFFWGYFDPTARALSYVNAGHNYPYLIHEDGSIHRLDKGGMILGVLQTTVPYEEEVVSLRPGDTLVLFTDGVSEAMTRDIEEYGERRLESALLRNAPRASFDIIEAVQADIQEHIKGAPQSDDITMMVLKIS